MTFTAEAAYADLVRRSKELSVLSSCSAVLGWDEQTYMPVGGAAHRGEQMALLAGLLHERATDPRLGELLALVEGSDLVSDAGSAPAVNARELRRAFRRRTRLPRELVQDLARTTSLAQQEWIAARRDNDEQRFRPWLEKIVGLKRQEAGFLLEVLPDRAPTSHSGDRDTGPSLYDALLDDYEPGARCRALAILFDALRQQLVPLVQTLAEAAASRASQSGVKEDSVLKRRFPLDRQKVFGEAVAAAVGFDFQRGRLDVTAHPFCTGIGPGDTRITTRYDERQFSDAFFGVLHEVGHGLYEQGLPAEHFGTPLGEAASLGVHESQSRLWENAVGRSRSFWAYWFPLARRVFHEALHDVSLDRFLNAVVHVEPSLIRVQADEVTYNLHIIIRFELEQAMLSGDLSVADLPGAWNQKYRELLGVTPATAAEGWLQDIHWSAGLFGYFPTYTLGNVYAAQLFARARSDLAGLDESLARGESAELLAWLRDNIHRHGQRHRPIDLIERASGARLDHRPLVESIRRRYAQD
jgi:carboxypeptidase Taq